MTWKEFNPQGSTGPERTDFVYRSDVTGPQGARYELLREKHHTGADVARAKRYLRRNFDVVSINVIKETI